MDSGSSFVSRLRHAARDREAKTRIYRIIYYKLQTLTPYVDIAVGVAVGAVGAVGAAVVLSRGKLAGVAESLFILNDLMSH